MRVRAWIGLVAIGWLTSSQAVAAPNTRAGAFVRELPDEASPLGEATCGKPGLPDCPLQAWMKANVVAPKAAGNAELLAKNLQRVAALAPASSGWGADWKTISDAGAIAAKKGDKDGVNAACTSCHAKYRKAYRDKYRESPVPS